MELDDQFDVQLYGQFIEEPPARTPQASHATAGWHLGLDIGTTGISAVLSNPLTGESHPVYWQARGISLSDRTATATTSWRLPAIAHLPSDFDQNEAETPIQLPIPGIPDAEGVLLCDIKAAFDIGLPYQPTHADDSSTSETGHDWEPQLHWYFQPAQSQRNLADQPPISLNLVLRVLTQLLSTRYQHHIINIGAFVVAFVVDALTTAS